MYKRTDSCILKFRNKLKTNRFYLKKKIPREFNKFTSEIKIEAYILETLVTMLNEDEICEYFLQKKNSPRINSNKYYLQLSKEITLTDNHSKKWITNCNVDLEPG